MIASKAAQEFDSAVTRYALELIDHLRTGPAFHRSEEETLP